MPNPILRRQSELRVGANRNAAGGEPLRRGGQPELFSPATAEDIFEVKIDGPIGQFVHLDAEERLDPAKTAGKKLRIPVRVTGPWGRVLKAEYSPRGNSSFTQNIIPKAELTFRKKDAGKDPLVTPSRELRVFPEHRERDAEVPADQRARYDAYMRERVQREYLLNNLLPTVGLNGLTSRLANVHYLDEVGGINERQLNILVEDVHDVGMRLGGKASKHTPEPYSEQDAASVAVFNALFPDSDTNHGGVRLPNGQIKPLVSDFDHGAFCSPSTLEDREMIREAREQVMTEVRDNVSPRLLRETIAGFVAAKPKMFEVIDHSAADASVKAYAKRFIEEGLAQLSGP